jgi:SAM-dependent methyltransferase
MKPTVNYNAIAPNYNARYNQNPLAGVSRALRALVKQGRARDVLEVGCGTGRWVSELKPLARRVAAGFARAEWRVAEHVQQEFVGQAILENPFTQKHGSSQLAMLSDAAYAAGLNRLHTALAGADGSPPVFVTDQWLTLLVGWAQ